MIFYENNQEDYLYSLIDNAIKNSNLEPFEYVKNDIIPTDNDLLVFDRYSLWIRM